MTEHSPAPWTIKPGDSVLAVSSGQRHIAVVGNGRYWEQSSEQDEADAKLIAAAPDLLGSLSDLLGMIGDLSDEALEVAYGAERAGKVFAARAAVAKARPA